MSADSPIAEQLCLSCGLCCNGVLFKDVELQPEDDPVRLRDLGMPVKSTRTRTRFAQPCQALECSRCKIYEDRPSYCRQFECVLFKSTMNGDTEFSTALKTIRTAHKRAEKVRRLLRELGDNNEHLPLSKRFNRVGRDFDTGRLSSDAAGLYGDLTIAVHELNFLLSSAFYPGR